MSGRPLFVQRSVWVVCAAALLAGCPDSEGTVPTPDAGLSADAAVAPPACDAPHSCREQSFDGVCRAGQCRDDVPCGADAECGLGETCRAGLCRFTGCVSDGDCGAGLCRRDVYACTECATSADCPADKPVCSDKKRCVSCGEDSDCAYPGPGYCDVARGACVHCKVDAHCGTGLRCGLDGTCTGAKNAQMCDPETGPACDVGLMCVTVGGTQQMCLRACDLYTNTCTGGEICVKLTFTGSAALVFEGGAPVGVCLPPFQGLRGYGEPCNNNCQPNLACTADSPAQSTCKAYCDPQAPLCAPGLSCHPFPGDWNGHQYGLCYGDNGFADPCSGDGDCRAGLSCVPRDDPSTSNELSYACAWSVGAGSGLSACSANSGCKSGHCRADPNAGGNPFFCFAACAEDSDCAVDGRLGYCDSNFTFTTQYVTAPGAEMRGCRPRCLSGTQCAAYGDYTCRSVADAQNDRFVQTCQPPLGSKLAGEGCVSDGECREGFCLRRDGRGVFRTGVCGLPCTQGTDCPSGLECEARSVQLSAGADGQPHTADDRRAAASFCGAGACTTNADCPAAQPHCVPDASAQGPLSGSALACRAAALGSVAAGAQCQSDADCQSGVCAERGTTGTRACFEACDTAAPSCSGGLTCTAGGARVRNGDGTFQTFDACL